MDLIVKPGRATDIGRYEIKTSARTSHKGRVVETAERTLIVQIKGSPAVWGIGSMIVILAAIVFAVAYFTVRWSRR